MTEGDTYSIMRGGGTRQGAEQEHHMQTKAKIRGTVHANTLIRLDESRNTTTCKDL